MGGDGGTIPKRSDLVNVKGYRFARGDHQGGLGSKPNLKTRAVASIDLAEHVSRYSTCVLTQLPLEHPAVCTVDGQFFIKEKILEALLRKTVPASLGVKSLKQLHSVSRDFRGVCQVSGAALGESALLVRPCGCILSRRSEMSENSECPVCGQIATAVLTLEPASRVQPAQRLKEEEQRPAKKPRIEDLDKTVSDLFH